MKNEKFASAPSIIMNYFRNFAADMGKITIAGLGPGSKEDITPAVLEAIQEADAIVGYKYYFQFIEPYVKDGCECIDTGMKKERERAEQAFMLAEQGKTVVVISSGDAGIYGMTPLVYEMQRERNSDVVVESLPGISAFQKAASLLGAPMGHDFCVISLSDLMTPWETIERRIRAAAVGDFVTAVYNPKSNGRYWQLYRLQEIFLRERAANTPVGYVRQAGREEQEVTVTTLGEFDPEAVDMFTVIIIGNSQSYKWNDKMITPRGYYREAHKGNEKKGQLIMMESFRTIESELKCKDYRLDHKWALLHAIHTTADFDMEDILHTDDGAVATLYNKVKNGELTHIITDVTMVTSGIRKGALQRLGDVEGERRVAARMRTHFDVIHPDVGHPVDGTEMQQDATVFPVAGHRESLLIPQCLVGADFLLHARQRRLDAEGHEDVALVFLGHLLPFRRDGVLPKAVEVFPFGTHHHRARVFGQRILGCHLRGPTGLDFVARRSILGKGHVS